MYHSKLGSTHIYKEEHDYEKDIFYISIGSRFGGPDILLGLPRPEV